MTELTPRKPEETNTLDAWLERPLSLYLTLDWEKVLYIAILLAAVLTRFWDLGFRAVSHDESLHTQYSYQYYNGQGYAHTPLMHGPFLFHVTALSYWLFGHSDFTARIPVAIFGIILVLIPYFLRDWIGRKGALFASFVLLISPYVSYYSRYIRHDVYVIIWALIIFIASWTYLRDRNERSIWWFAFGLALMYSTKEVSFLYTAIFGSFLVIRLVVLASKETWFKKSYRKLTPAILLVLVGLILSGVGYLIKTQSEAALDGAAISTVDPNQPDSFAANPDADPTVAVDTGDESGTITTMRWLILAGMVVVSGGLFTVFSRV